MKRRRRFLASALITPLLFPLAVVSPAQDEPKRDEPKESPYKNVFLLDREPYKNWTTHTGRPTDAAVAVRVILTDFSTGEKEVRTGSGFVVRCDGFVMAPSSLFSLAMTLPSGATGRCAAKDAVIELTFAAENGAKPQRFTGQYPRFLRESVPFTLVKMNDHHFKAAQMLHPRNILGGKPVLLVYGNQSGVAETKTATIGDLAAAKEGYRVPLTFTGDAPRLPGGTMVVEPESQLVLGIVPSSGSAEFATFRDLHRITNAVPMLPDPRAKENPQQPNGEVKGMVWIPGGPTALAEQTARDYASMYGKWVVCMPGFWIDRREVTNAEYRDFLLETGRRPPAGFTDEVNSAWWRELPVTGVTTADAEAYADWAGKRLVTPIEWARASAGSEIALNQYLAAVHSGASQLSSSMLQLDANERDIIQLKVAEARSRGAVIRGVPRVQSFELEQIQADREELVRGFDMTFLMPGQLVPAGWREPDKSVFGVYDVALNAQEILQPNASHRLRETVLKQNPKLIYPTLQVRYKETSIWGGPGQDITVFAAPGTVLPPPALGQDGRLLYSPQTPDGFIRPPSIPRRVLPNGIVVYPDQRVGISTWKPGFRCAR